MRSSRFVRTAWDQWSAFRTFGDTSGEALLHEFAQWAAGHTVVGVSTNQIFNASHVNATTSERLAPADTVFFADPYGTGPLVTRPLLARATVALPLSER